MNHAQEIRKQKRLEKLGSNNPVCTVCGETDWRCLELHHIAGKDHGEELAIVCRNCHRKLSDTQKDYPQKMRSESSVLEALGYYFLGQSDLQELMVAKLREGGRMLIQAAQKREDV